MQIVVHDSANIDKHIIIMCEPYLLNVVTMISQPNIYSVSGM